MAVPNFLVRTCSATIYSPRNDVEQNSGLLQRASPCRPFCRVLYAKPHRALLPSTSRNPWEINLILLRVIGSRETTTRANASAFTFALATISLLISLLFWSAVAHFFFIYCLRSPSDRSLALLGLRQFAVARRNYRSPLLFLAVAFRIATLSVE